MDDSDLGHDVDLIEDMLDRHGFSAVLVILTAACASTTERAVLGGDLVSALAWTKRSAAVRDLRLDRDWQWRDAFEKQDE